jgi:hypothetical protein
MEIFVLSFAIFVLAGLGLALHALLGRRPSAARWRPARRVGDFDLCCGRCFYADEDAP